MELLGKTLSEKTEKIYTELKDKLTDTLVISKMDLNNKMDVERPCYHDVKAGEYVIKLDDQLADPLFENALLRNLIYCVQMEEGSPILDPNPQDQLAMTAAAMINSTVLDINLEQRLADYGVEKPADLDTMRLEDFFMFLRTDTAQTNRSLYDIVVSLQMIMLYFTVDNEESVNQVLLTFEMSDPALFDLIHKGIDIIEKYGYDTTRGQMRCMRKLALMLGMKDKIKVYYEGQATLV